MNDSKNNITRIQYAAGQNATLGNAIMASNPIRLIARIKPNGEVKYYQVTQNPTNQSACIISTTEFILP